MAFLLPYLATAAAAYGGHKLASHGEHSSHSSHSHSSDSSGMEKLPTYTHKQNKMLQDILKRINPKAMDLFKSPLFQQSQNYISDFLKTSPDEQYKNFEKPIMSQFQQEIMPGIAERFSGMDAQNSSGFQQALGAAGGNLAERLGMLREGLKSNYQGMQLNAANMGANMAQMPVNNMLNMATLGLGGQPFAYSEKPQSAWEGMMPGIGSAATKYGLPKLIEWLMSSGGGSKGSGTSTVVEQAVNALAH